MKYILSLTAILFLASFRPPSDIYSFTLKTIDGKKIELSQYSGKKILFMLVPLSGSDPNVSITDIVNLQKKYAGSLAIIGIPSVEAGYTTGDSTSLKKLYKDLAPDLTITEAMQVKKGSAQSPLLQWLTGKGNNHHFDEDVVWPVGTKFFVDETGELYAVMGPHLSLTGSMIDKIIGRTPTGKTNQAAH